ncbi:hypothetical protein ACM39_16970 [Chryseobacterium sp. FH2]|uniref:hypothetical protein n=1 Tax=Chryseobacterium sp. FH2 TaxID=1674291 RepID=UPI00065AA7B8|nr:hypothetical protein [Chryseobacterium sp. FH2]KMQ64217.1 hypothetical protein ACM39_16970 [Chryseobacterium sp. FH2]
MKKLLNTCKIFAVLSVLMLNSCRNEDSEIQSQETVYQKVTVADLKNEIILSGQALPEIVQSQINTSKINLEKHLKNELQITGITVLGKISTSKGLEISQNLISQKDNFIAAGNIVEPETVKIGKIQSLNSGEELNIAQTELKNLFGKEITVDSNVIEISWDNKGEKFTSLCFYNDSGIIWDNILGGLIMMDQRGNAETSDAQSKVSSKWYKQWWTANWLWGSKRGEIGYKITIYYSGSTVSNVDVSDWGSISLGKAKSESKVTKKTGAYGQCRYALGLCTPTGSLSFNSSNFSVSFSGLGSNIVSNGTKSLYP